MKKVICEGHNQCKMYGRKGYGLCEHALPHTFRPEGHFLCEEVECFRAFYGKRKLKCLSVEIIKPPKLKEREKRKVSEASLMELKKWHARGKPLEEKAQILKSNTILPPEQKQCL